MYWLTGIVGLFMILAPYIFNYAGNGTALWTSVIAGLIVVGASLWEAFAKRKENWEYWVAGIVGVLAIIAPFVLGFGHIATAMWTTVLAGAFVAIVAGSQVFGGGKLT